MRRLALVCLCLSFTWRAAAQSSADALELDWDAPAECGGEDRIRGALSQRLGERAVTRSEPLEAEGTIERTPGGYALVLVTDAGERRLEAAECDELVQSAAVILALLIDPTVPSEPEPEPEPEPPAQPKAAETSAWNIYVRAEAAADLGLLPKLGVGPGLALGLTIHDTSIELSGTYFPTQDPVLAMTGDVGDVRLLSARVGVCQMVVREPAFGPCVFAEYGYLYGEGGGGGVETPRNDEIGLGLLLLAARVSVPLGSAFGWSAELAAGLPTLEVRFRVDDDVVYETSAVVGRLRTGFELRF